MPVLMDALKGMSAQDLKVVIPVAKSLSPSILESYLKNCPFPYELVSGQAQLVMNAADAVVVASGTASLESALLNKPTCIIYKSSWLNYYLARRFMKVNYLGLSNLLQGQMVVPELLQDDCNAQELTKMFELILHSEMWRSTMVRRLQQLNHSLIPQQHHTLPNLVLSLIGLN
jgi:lipid-A-disaccharide synthase